jgi:hypothetical protein
MEKLIRHKELRLSPEMVKRLQGISSATIDNRLALYRRKLKRKINGTTKPGSLIQQHIPIRTKSWDEKRVGYCELDTVTHCGALVHDIVHRV